MPEPTPPDSWPAPEDASVGQQREKTLRGDAPPPPLAPPPTDRGVGAGMLLAISVLALVAAGILIGYLLTNRSSNDQKTTTVVVTTTRTTTAAAPRLQSATLPDVSGQTEATAVTALGGAGILASIVFVPASDPLGTVIQQAKPAGTTVPFHSHLQINISRGMNDNPLATVPNVIGKTLQEAVSATNTVHLRLIYLKYPVKSRAQAGKVVQQTPLSGAQAPRNGQIVVYLGALKKA